jgi:iron complex transport system permease protein
MMAAPLRNQAKTPPHRFSYTLLCLGLTVGLAAVFAFALKTGEANLTLVQTFMDFFSGQRSDETVILIGIRLPRAVLGVLVGGSLGLAGAAMQGLLRNPLAEPGVLGVTGGAALGAVLVFYSGFASFFALALPLGGMAGAFFSVFLLYAFAGRMSNVQTLILAGVALNTLAFAGTSLALNLSPNPYASLEIVYWQMGSLADRSFHHVALVLPFIAAGWVLFLWDARALDVLTLGDETAASLGVSLTRLRARLIWATALSVGAAVSVCGSIGFVGLVVPHLLRPFVRNEPSKLLVASALGGAIMLLLADTGVRLIPTIVELKLGVLTSLVGAPFFIALIFKMRRSIT